MPEDCPRSAKDGSKTAQKAPRRAEEGPEKGPKVAQEGPEAAQAGIWTAQARASPHWATAHGIFQYKLSRFWAVLGFVMGPKLGPKSSKIAPGARPKTASSFE